MVNLNAAQAAIVSKLNKLREQYDKDEETLEARVTAAKEFIKQPIREAVQEAEGAGIPAMRIYNALGFSQPGPYLRFLKQPFTAGSFDGGASLLTSPAQVHTSGKAVASWTESNDPDSDWPSIDVTDVDGTVIPLIVDIDRRVTDRVVVDANNGWYKYEGETKAEVRAAIIEFLTEQFGKPIEWE